jgi:hypothetical protein
MLEDTNKVPVELTLGQMTSKQQYWTKYSFSRSVKLASRHYSAADQAGLHHFAATINLLIANVNLTSAEELNSAWEVMLHKGHPIYYCEFKPNAHFRTQ